MGTLSWVTRPQPELKAAIEFYGGALASSRATRARGIAVSACTFGAATSTACTRSTWPTTRGASPSTPLRHGRGGGVRWAQSACW